MLALAEQIDNLAELATRPEALTEEIMKTIASISKSAANTISMHAMTHDEDDVIDFTYDLDAAEALREAEELLRGTD